MLLGICKEKIKKVSAAFANALMSARLMQTVCYMLAAYLVYTQFTCPHAQKQIMLNVFALLFFKLGLVSPQNLHKGQHKFCVCR